MRLLHTRERRLEFFVGDEVPEYVILSHTWDKDEVTYEDFRSGIAEAKPGWSKVANTCAQACKDGYNWVWIDSCCIDKSSSSELSESINSMWNWYKQANICYAFLADVEDGEEGESFAASRWFTRGWTLQELIAPISVEFFSTNWNFIGTKQSRCREISALTGIPNSTLITSVTSTSNAAQRMSWTAHRECTRAEDMAYCLLGIFQITMPLLYGEGGRVAFLRLQIEILTRSRDETLYLFARCPRNTHTSLLAEAVWQFCEVSECERCDDGTVSKCFNLPITYEEVQPYALDDAVINSNTEIKISSYGIRGTFKILSADSLRSIAPRRPLGEIVAVLLLNVKGPSKQLFAIAVGKKNLSSHLNYINVFRLVDKPILISQLDASFALKQIDVGRPYWLALGRSVEIIVTLPSSGTFRYASISSGIISAGRAAVVDKKDYCLKVRLDNPALRRSIFWIAQNDDTHCALLFQAVLTCTRDNISCVIRTKEYPYDKVQHVSGRDMPGNTHPSDDGYGMCMADYCNLHLKDGRWIQVRARRRSAQRNTAHVNMGRSLNYRIDIKGLLKPPLGETETYRSVSGLAHQCYAQAMRNLTVIAGEPPEFDHNIVERLYSGS